MNAIEINEMNTIRCAQRLHSCKFTVFKHLKYLEKQLQETLDHEDCPELDSCLPSTRLGDLRQEEAYILDHIEDLEGTFVV